MKPNSLHFDKRPTHTDKSLTQYLSREPIMKEITIRKAVASDFEAVVEMSEGIYSGHDYFPCVFHQWLDKPNRTIFVAQYGDKLIGLRAIHIVDEGRTFISQGLRIHPRFRGFGLSSRLIEAIHGYIRREYPNVCRERFTTKSDNIERLAIQKKYGDTGLFERDILAYYVFKDTVKKKTLDEAAENFDVQVKPCSRNFLHNCILDDSVANMFPGRTIIVDWEPFEALRSNIDCIFEEGDCVFSDRDTTDCSGDQLPKSFAHGRRSPRVNHMHWVASIYTKDPVMFQVHVVQQLKSAYEEIQGDFIFSTFHKQSHTKWGKKLLEENIGLKSVEFFRDFGLMMFERKFVK